MRQALMAVVGLVWLLPAAASLSMQEVRARFDAGEREAILPSALYFARKDVLDAQWIAGTVLIERGSQTDVFEGYGFIETAAYGGHVKAQTQMALFSLHGTVLSVDDAAARWWAIKAAQYRDPDALYLLGWMHARGRGVPVSHSVAAEWWEQAAAYGHPLGQRDLARAYRDGAGVRQDRGRATQWFRAAASQGEPSALGEYARLLYNQPDTPPQQQLYWAALAAAAGQAGAAQMAHTLHSTLPRLTVQTARLNVRDAPGITARVVTRIGPKDSLTLLARTTGWYQVHIASDHTVGWVSADLVRYQP